MQCVPNVVEDAFLYAGRVRRQDWHWDVLVLSAVIISPEKEQIKKWRQK